MLAHQFDNELRGFSSIVQVRYQRINFAKPHAPVQGLLQGHARRNMIGWRFCDIGLSHPRMP